MSLPELAIYKLRQGRRAGWLLGLALGIFYTPSGFILAFRSWCRFSNATYSGTTRLRSIPSSPQKLARLRQNREYFGPSTRAAFT